MLHADHLHLVLRGCSADADLVAFIKRAKQASGYEYRRITGQPLWQVGYYDRVLRDEDEERAAIRYALENPVTAGLAATAEAYPYSGTPTPPTSTTPTV